jgi:hypothetical protein
MLTSTPDDFQGGPEVEARYDAGRLDVDGYGGTDEETNGLLFR